MGGIGDFLFGSPEKKTESSSSSSGNYAWDSINGAFKPALGYVTQGGNAISALLGLSGDGAAQKSALENFSNSSGMGFLRDQINNQVTSNKAASGLLNSGSTLTALQDRGAQLGSTYLNQYMQNLFGLGQLGLGAGNVMADAGRWSKSESQGKATGAKDGHLGDIISAGAMIFSDPRLKTDVVKVGEASDGLGIYDYTMIHNGVRKRGVMSNEVKQLRPWAFVPNVHGTKYDGVNLSKLGSLD